MSKKVLPLIDGVVWRPVVGYGGLYEVSDTGRVRGLDRLEIMSGRHATPYLRTRAGRELTPRIGSVGYPTIILSKGGKGKMHLVHRLVATAFIGLPERGWEVNHKDGIKDNNHLTNLEWSNRKHNSLHSTKVLRKNIGTLVASSKLTEVQVLEIWEMLKSGGSQTLIAAKFAVTNHAIYRIKHGYNWAWLTGYGKEVEHAQISQ